MYFAIESAQPDVLKQITKALADLRPGQDGAPLHVCALIDGVFDEKLLARRPWSRQEHYSLYEGTDLKEFGRAAPHLLAAPADIDKRNDWLQEILVACDGKPMLSVLASRLEAPELRQHFQPYLVARAEDLTEWPLRWGDTRVLPEIIEAVDFEQRAHLLSPLYVWWSTQRNGALMAWKGFAAPVPPTADFEKLPLSDKAFARLVDHAEADAVLANIHDTHPDLLQHRRPADCHARVAKHLLVANEYGIDAANARQHFSMLALSLDEQFTRHPDMAALLKHTQQGADYAAEIKALPERFWQEAG